MQLKTSSRSMKLRALAALQEASPKGDYRLNLISLALKGKKVSFDKVLKMIDDMIALLGQEQRDDNDKKEYCEKLIDQTEDNLKSLELTVSTLEKQSLITKSELQLSRRKLNRSTMVSK